MPIPLAVVVPQSTIIISIAESLFLLFVLQMTDSPKPAFGSGPFSQSGFGNKPSGGFSGGSFSAQGGSVASSGFGFGASPSSGINCLNCIFPSPLSFFSFDGALFGPFEVKLEVFFLLVHMI